MITFTENAVSFSVIEERSSRQFVVQGNKLAQNLSDGCRFGGNVIFGEEFVTALGKLLREEFLINQVAKVTFGYVVIECEISREVIIVLCGVTVDGYGVANLLDGGSDFVLVELQLRRREVIAVRGLQVLIGVGKNRRDFVVRDVKQSRVQILNRNWVIGCREDSCDFVVEANHQTYRAEVIEICVAGIVLLEDFPQDIGVENIHLCEKFGIPVVDGRVVGERVLLQNFVDEHKNCLRVVVGHEIESPAVFDAVSADDL